LETDAVAVAVAAAAAAAAAAAVAERVRGWEEERRETIVGKSKKQKGNVGSKKVKGKEHKQ